MTGPYVWMRHPDLPENEPVEAPRQAFEGVYQHRGWVEVEETPEPAQADLDATLRPTEPEAAPAEPDAPAPTGGRSATRGKAGTSKAKES